MKDVLQGVELGVLVFLISLCVLLGVIYFLQKYPTERLSRLHTQEITMHEDFETISVPSSKELDDISEELSRAISASSGSWNFKETDSLISTPIAHTVSNTDGSVQLGFKFAGLETQITTKLEHELSGSNLVETDQPAILQSTHASQSKKKCRICSKMRGLLEGSGVLSATEK